MENSVCCVLLNNQCVNLLWCTEKILYFLLSKYRKYLMIKLPVTERLMINQNYTKPQKNHRNFDNSLRYGKQSIYFFSLNYKLLVLITKS